MNRYCVEIAGQLNHYIVHKQKCGNLSHAELLSVNRLFDLGDHRDELAALSQAGMSFPKPLPCLHCLNA